MGLKEHQEVLGFIRDLQNKIIELEKRVQVLEGSKHKSTSVDLTTFPTPDCEIQPWITTLQLEQDQLTMVFTHGYIQGMTMILCEYIEQHNPSPIKPNPSKKSTFYVYKDQKWQVLDTTTLEQIIDIVQSKLFKVFKTWKDSNPKYLSDEFNDIYSKYHQNVMGTKSPKAATIQRIKTSLYTNLI